MRRSTIKSRRNQSTKPRLHMEHLEARLAPALFVVNTLVDVVDPDPGFTSLREALIGANANPGPDTIQFNTAGVIAITSPLPDLSDATGGTIIDGKTATGYAGTPVISLAGPGSGSGLRITSGGNTVDALGIGGFAIGLEVSGASAAGNVVRNNVISDNLNAGVAILSGATATLVQSNKIGTDATGAAPAPNGGPGALIGTGAHHNRLELNTIGFNGGDGIRVAAAAGTGNVLDRIASFSNGGLGINLEAGSDPASGATPNDAGDADSGPNGLQNFPAITSAVVAGANVQVAYSLNSTPNTSFAVQFYRSAAADASGFGEGQSFIGGASFTTDAGGNFSSTILLPSVPLGHVISATATALTAQNTSEYSEAVAVTNDGAQRTWTGGGATSNFSDPANWGGTAPVAGDHLEFGPGTPTSLVNDLAPGTSFGSLKFTSGGFVLNGNSLKVGAGMDVRGAAGTSVTVNVDVSIANDLLPYIEQDNLLPYIEQDNVLTLNGIFNGAFGLEKLGRGTMILNAANTYAGVTHVTQGVLNIRHSQALGSNAAGTELWDGTLELEGGVNVQGESLRLLPYIEQENFVRSVTGVNTWTGNWHFDPICPPIVVEAGSQLTMSGQISGDGGMHKDGDGAFVLSGANTFDGVVHVEEGTLRLENSLALGSTALGTELHGGSLELKGGLTVAGETLGIVDGTSNIRSVSGANTWTGNWHIDPICPPIVVEAGSQLTMSGQISGDGGMHKDGDGAFVLSGANTFDGVVHVEEGTLRLENSLALGSTALGTELHGGSLELKGGLIVVSEKLGIVDGTSNIRNLTGDNTWTGNWHFDPICPPIVVEAGSMLTLSGVLSGPGGFHKDGDGTFVLSGANTFDGESHVAEGTLRLENSQALGTTAGATEIRGGATLETIGNIDFDDDLHAVGSPPGSQLPAVTIRNLGGFLRINEGLTTVNPLLRFEIDSGTIILDREITGDDDIELEGPGALVVESDNDELNGSIIVKSGTLEVNGNWAAVPVVVEGGSVGGSGVVGPITIDGGTIEGAIIQASPLVPGQFDLVVGGTAGNDDLVVAPASSGSAVEVTLNGTSLGAFAPTGRVLVYGQDGDDDLQADGNLGRPAWLYGGEGDDDLYAGGGCDLLFGDAGNDKLRARGGADSLDGGADDDELWGGAGGDSLVGGDGNDNLRAGAGGDTLIGGNGCDSLKGGNGCDWIEGGADNDRLDGQAGDDILLGGAGDDLIMGGNGRDLMIGGLGADRVEGNSDEDILIAGFTLFDGNATALNAIAAEWRCGSSYATRVANISNGTGLTLGFRLRVDSGAVQTVFDDNALDVLCGGQGADWFFANLNGGGVLDEVSDHRANELWSDTDF